MTQNLVENYAAGAKKIIFTALSIVAGLIVLTGFQSGYSTGKKNKKPRAEYKEPSYFAPIKYTNGVGLFADMNLSAEFFKQNNIKGPVFNNYDIGSYLIYHLYLKEPEFVDNRPEAYSVDFFKKTYIPMQ